MAALDWSADCSCGHRRWRHNHNGTGECLAVTQQIDMTGLPKPEYAPSTELHPKAWPLNWPPVVDLPVKDEPCGCRVFTDPEDTP